jgi:hypothetical protein
MFGQRVSAEEAVRLLDLKDGGELQGLLQSRLLQSEQHDPTTGEFLVKELIMCKLAQVMVSIGVSPEKAWRYAEAVLASRLAAHDGNPLEWVENEAQELFCQVADMELARIFLRAKEDGREIEVGAVKPMLFPTTRSEINVFRVVRPVIYRAQKLLRSRAK